jgi:starch phosphorylase
LPTSPPVAGALHQHDQRRHPRRWLAQANPGLSALLDSTPRQAAGGWTWTSSSGLRALPTTPVSANAFMRRQARQQGAPGGATSPRPPAVVDPDSLFDVQVKRIHEYKRQLLNVLHVVSRATRPSWPTRRRWVPRTVIFAGKAASQLPHGQSPSSADPRRGQVINNDPRIGDRLKVVFIPNYGVSVAEVIMPAADLSEQISTAGTEASGTGNMKLALNGALTIGTDDGANIEIRQNVGDDNIFIFGQEDARGGAPSAPPATSRCASTRPTRAQGGARRIAGGAFSRPDEPGRYRPLVDACCGAATTTCCWPTGISPWLPGQSVGLAFAGYCGRLTAVSSLRGLHAYRQHPRCQDPAFQAGGSGCAR